MVRICAELSFLYRLALASLLPIIGQGKVPRAVPTAPSSQDLPTLHSPLGVRGHEVMRRHFSPLSTPGLWIDLGGTLLGSLTPGTCAFPYKRPYAEDPVPVACSTHAHQLHPQLHDLVPQAVAGAGCRWEQ